MILALPDQQFFVRHFNNNQRLTRKGFYAGNSRTEEMTNALSSGCVHWDRAGSLLCGLGSCTLTLDIMTRLPAAVWRVGKRGL